MARPIRIEYEGAVYHVTIRGNDRKALFSTDADRERLVSSLAEKRNKERSDPKSPEKKYFVLLSGLIQYPNKGFIPVVENEELALLKKGYLSCGKTTYWQGISY